MNANDKIKSDLNGCLSSGKYAKLFLDDLINLVVNQNISPEVIFREIRIMEGKEEPLMNNLDSDLSKILIGDYEMDFNRSPSATKEYLEFRRLPLKGLYHKHYHVYQGDFIEINIENQQKKYPGINSLGAMMTRIAEGSLTGEWIVFKKKNSINTYICLAKHTDGDSVIFNRLIENNVDMENHDCF